ncbi:uncharacterized protein LOC118463267 isoform X2 [Anopheles albimanus]|uniref:uncharacterized protein LOC118463267 isoform X2 n=1 Tax=Anopheles albimanus TaxID=7167 RepID=UPI00163EDF9F|nr:uncharacterized protein LOC118463267 isoform X2 [Anopheles albimanus]
MTLRIIPLLLVLSVGATVLLLGDSVSATANNHQLSSSSLSSSALAATATGTPVEVASSGAVRLRGVKAAQLVDNKIHDKLQHPVSGASQQPIVTASAVEPQPVRRKRENAFADSVGPAVPSNYAPDGSLLPRITEDVLLVSNLTEERLREENELLEHLNRDRFPGRLIAPPDDVTDLEVRQGLQRNGKKGRRRKGHKKHKKHSKIKLLPVTLVGLPVDEQGRPESRIALEAMETSAGRNPWTLEGDQTRSVAVDSERPLEIRTEIDRVDEVRPETRRTAGSDTLPMVRNVVDVVDVWKETTMPQPASPVTTDSRRRPSAFVPPPPVLVADGHLVFGGSDGSMATGSVYNSQGSGSVQRQGKHDRQQRKKFTKGETRRIITPPLPARGTAIASSASTVTFPADDHQGTETVSVARVIIAGDLSCMQDDFVPAPAIANADIKYLRNDLYGLENSFLEAEYHCRMGYRLRTNRSSSSSGSSTTATGTGGGAVITSTGAITNGNLVCRKSRWIGKRPACVRIKSSPAGGLASDGSSSYSSSSCGKNHGCPQACHRVPQTGNQSAPATVCSCYKGFKMVNHRCVDINECVEYGEDVCEYGCSNTIGSFTCKCPRGLRVTDNNKCMVVNESLKLADVICAPLFPPRHGYLECSRPIDKIADGPSRGSLKITDRPGSQCILKCSTGYRLEGKFSKICGSTGEWIGDENGTCIRYPQPKLICPTSVNVELHPSDTENTTVRLRHPETDVSWERDVVVEPAWAKKDAFQLPLGSQNVSYSARHPVSKLHTDCTFTINVLPGSPPRVDFCPDTQVYTIEGRHQSVKATWEEPVFSDNVGVVTITKSNSPGTDFGAGSHLITYEAHDDAEWKSRCVFKIVVNVNPQQQQSGGQSNHLQLPILYNRFYF